MACSPTSFRELTSGTYLSMALQDVLATELDGNLSALATFLSVLFGVEAGVVLLCLLLFWQLK